MDKTETSVGDTETGEPTNTMAGKSPPEAPVAASTVESGSVAKGVEASIGERVLIGVLLTVVIAVAIGGIVLALVLDSREDNKNLYIDGWNDDGWNDDGWNDDFRWGNVGATIVESPFEVEDSLFSLNVTEPYASIEDLRKDIEALAKTFANTVILSEANQYQPENDYFPETSTETLTPSDATTSFFETSPRVDFDAVEASVTKATRSFRNVDDFETYQHEAGVVSGDLVKSNGAHVFASVGDRIEVWDIEGNLFETTTIRSVRPEENDASIVALHINPEGSKLTVISSEYHLPIYGGHTGADPIIENSSETRVTIFSIDGSTLTEISHTYIDGYPANSYAVGNNVHVVTRMTLQTWTYINNHLYRYNFEDDLANSENILTNEEYVAVATRRAEEIMPEFVDKVIELVTEEDEIILSRLIGFRNSVNDYKSVTQVSSFDINKVSNEDGMELHASKSLTFQAGMEEHCFATDEWIWVSHLKYGWGPLKLEYLEYTMLLGFRLDGASSTFAAVGSVPGHLLNQFSIDFVKDDDKEYVRIAVTEFFQNDFQDDWMWGRQSTEPTSEDEAESRTLNQIIVLEIPKVEDGSQKINELVQLGSVSVGKKHEFITAVRFFDTISYVVTFEQTDPFYVLDLSDPMDPKILGEFQVTGFSEFMHPINEDNSMLLTVGQGADENGDITGFQISIFNSTIPNDPKLVDRFVISVDDNSLTSSASTWDEKSFRYIQVGEVGRLILPLYSYNWVTDVNFDGFAVFGVDLNGSESLITREILINHYTEEKWNSNGWNCNIRLPIRSFVFDGNLMTMKDSNVVSTDLVSQETKWSLSLEETENCCSN